MLWVSKIEAFDMDMKHGRNRYQWIAWINTKSNTQILSNRTKQNSISFIKLKVHQSNKIKFKHHGRSWVKTDQTHKARQGYLAEIDASMKPIIFGLRESALNQ